MKLQLAKLKCMYKDVTISKDRLKQEYTLNMLTQPATQ